MTGHWKGYYQYSNAKDQAAMGFEKTYFEIYIDSFDGKKFRGTVQDDVTTGGMEDEGKIIGFVENGKISFEKHMPREVILYPDGQRQSSHRRHPTLYYSGTLFNNSVSARGLWKFRWRIVFVLGIIPIPHLPCKGTWAMEKKPGV